MLTAAQRRTFFWESLANSWELFFGASQDRGACASPPARLFCWACAGCTPLHSGVHSLHARSVGVCTPQEGVHTPNKRARLLGGACTACTPFRRGVHSLHALLEGRARCARPSREACTSITRLSAGMGPGSRNRLPGRQLREPCGV